MAEPTEPAAIRGSLRPEGATGTVRMEVRYDTTPEDLWSALTEPDRLARWIVRVDGDLRVGGAIDLAFTSGWSGRGRVDVCERPYRLRITSGDGDDVTVIEAVLMPDGEATRLVVEERGLPSSRLPANGAGWQVHIEDLTAHLEGRPASDWKARWQQLVPAYEPRPD